MALEPGIPLAGTLPMREHDKIDDGTGNKRVDIWGFDGSNWNRGIVHSNGSLDVNVITGGGASGTEWDDGDAIDTTSQGTLLIATDGIPGTARALRCTAAGLMIVADGGGSITVDGPLTDAELRATPVPVSATNLDIRDLSSASDSVSAVQGTSPWVVSGTVTVTPLTSTAGTPSGFTVSTSAIILKASNASRRAIAITNNGTSGIFIGHTSGVTASGAAMGLKLRPGGTYVDSGDGLYTGDIYAIGDAVAASQNVSVSERT